MARTSIPCAFLRVMKSLEGVAQPTRAAKRSKGTRGRPPRPLVSRTHSFFISVLRRDDLDVVQCRGLPAIRDSFDPYFIALPQSNAVDRASRRGRAIHLSSG